MIKINHNEKIIFKNVDMTGAKNVKMKILIGLKDGSKNIIMRHFQVAPGGETPYHQHNYEHVIKVEKGTGTAIDENKEEHEITVDNSLYVEPNKMHQFKNNSQEDFEFICIIPDPNKNSCTLK